MTKLALIGRPYVAFDESNPNHRKWFHTFTKTSTWGHCPVRFAIEDEAGDLVTIMSKRMLNHYFDQEFKK